MKMQTDLETNRPFGDNVRPFQCGSKLMTKGKRQSGRGEVKTLISSAGHQEASQVDVGRDFVPGQRSIRSVQSFHIKSLAFIFFLVKKKKDLWDKWSVDPQVSSQYCVPCARCHAESRAES